MSTNEIDKEIRVCLSLISNHIPSGDELLFETGVLDSFDMIDLILSI